METQIIQDAKNIYLIPSKDPESIASALALFYTLKDLNKNVNLLAENLPENVPLVSALMLLLQVCGKK